MTNIDVEMINLEEEYIINPQKNSYNILKKNEINHKNKMLIYFSIISIICIIIGFTIYGMTLPRCKKNICKYNSIPQCCENSLNQSCHDYTEYNSFTKCNDINKKCNVFKCKLVYNNITIYEKIGHSNVFEVPGGDSVYILYLISTAFISIILITSILMIIGNYNKYSNWK